MRGIQWRGWVSGIAVALSVVAALPARAAGPPRRAPLVSQKDVEEAKRLQAEAVQLHAQGKDEQALSLAERALSLREKALGAEHPKVASSLIDMAVLCSEKGDHGRAEPLYQRALAILEKALGPDHPDVATTLNGLALLHRRKGDARLAEPLYQRILAIREKAFGPFHPEVATTLNALASLYRSRGEYGRAEPLLRRALAIREKAQEQGHPDVADAINNLAEAYREMGDYDRAEPLLLRSLTLREQALGPTHPDVALSLHNLAGLYWTKGDYGRAEPLLRRALAIREKALGPEHPSVARSLGNLAELYRSKGDYARAEPLLLRTLGIREKVLGPDHPDVANALNNLGMLYAGKGDDGRAEPLLQRALAIREKSLGEGHPDVATSVNNLALLFWRRGDDDHAEPLLQRALSIWEKALGEGHPNVGSALNNLAELYQEKGDDARAEPLLRRALSIREKALGHGRLDVAQSLNNLAELYRRRGDTGRAEPLYLRALSIWEKEGGPDHADVANGLNNQASLYAAQGRMAEAFKAALRAADIQDRNAAVLVARDSEEQKRLYMATLMSATSGAISLHVQRAPADPAAARLALTVLLRRKGRVLDSMADSLAALRRTLGPDDRALLDRLASVYTKLATQVSRGLSKASPEQYRATLVALEQERQTLEQELGKRSAAFRAEQRLVTPADVQAALPDGAALVEIALYRPFNLRAVRRVDRWGAPRYVAYVVRREGEPVFADLGEATAIDAAVDKLRRALGDANLTHDPKPAARALDALLMQPIRKLLGETRWVFVSPDGPLSLLPFGALVDEQGHSLVERYLFSTLTSGRDLLRFQTGEAPLREAPLLLANPAFEDISAPVAPGATHRGVRSLDMNLKVLPLESTGEEARAIAQLFPEARVLLGARATEGAVKAAHGPRLLHLATHGFFLPEMPLPDALLAGPGGELTPAERAAIAQRENPLLRSGIALAGFNQRHSGDDDGVLTALEATGLDLYGTRLVVLSACESGLGKATMGEGVVGLRRALSMAGAETQVMSLWQVDTGRTRELMIAYYKRLQAGVGRSEAMREVQLAMLADAQTAHPNLWASFVVSGDWRTLEGKARLPEVGKVAPGVRGCACEHAGRETREHGAWLSLALGLAVLGRRLRSPRRARASAKRRRPRP
jgi:CHAT domain-containing protein/tetratricopeptide (TPR) repeat protein